MSARAPSKVIQPPLRAARAATIQPVQCIWSKQRGRGKLTTGFQTRNADAQAAPGRSYSSPGSPFACRSVSLLDQPTPTAPPMIGPTPQGRRSMPHQPRPFVLGQASTGAPAEARAAVEAILAGPTHQRSSRSLESRSRDRRCIPPTRMTRSDAQPASSPRVRRRRAGLLGCRSKGSRGEGRPQTDASDCADRSRAERKSWSARIGVNAHPTAGLHGWTERPRGKSRPPGAAANRGRGSGQPRVDV